MVDNFMLLGLASEETLICADFQREREVKMKHFIMAKDLQ